MGSKHLFRTKVSVFGRLLSRVALSAPDATDYSNVMIDDRGDAAIASGNVDTNRIEAVPTPCLRCHSHQTIHPSRIELYRIYKITGASSGRLEIGSTDECLHSSCTPPLCPPCSRHVHVESPIALALSETCHINLGHALCQSSFVVESAESCSPYRTSHPSCARQARLLHHLAARLRLDAEGIVGDAT